MMVLKIHFRVKWQSVPFVGCSLETTFKQNLIRLMRADFETNRIFIFHLMAAINNIS